jgi:hypothetical protein
MSDESSAASSTTTQTETSRRRLLAWMGAGGGAVLATLFTRNEAQAGHDGTNVLHLGEFNNAPSGSFAGGTLLVSEAQGRVFDVRNSNAGGQDAGAIQAWSRGGGPAVQGNATTNLEFPPTGSGVGVMGTTGSGQGVAGHSTSGSGVEGHSRMGTGVKGFATDPGGTGTGVSGQSALGPGVQGISDGGPGVSGRSNSGTGGAFSSESGRALTVVGRTSMTAEIAATDGDTLFVENRQTGDAGGGAISGIANGGAHGVEGITNGLGVGVRGVAGSDPFGHGPGDGVHGSTGTGIGVLGHTNAAGIGVEARSETPDGVALQVRGSARFSTAGAATIPAGVDAVFVANPAVTEESHVSVTLVSDPGPRQLAWVERNPGSGFTVHTSSHTKRTPETSLTYLAVEPYED